MRRFFASLIALVYLLAATPAPAGFVINSYALISPITYVLTDTAAIPTNGTVFSYTSFALGTETADRIMVCGVMGRSTSGNGGAHPTSFVINGVTATMQVGVIAALDNGMEIYSAAVPTGTSVTVTATYAGSQHFAAVACWAVYNATSITAVDSATSEANPGTTSAVDGLAGDLVIAYSHTSAVHTNTWSGTMGVVEDFDLNEIESSFSHTGASILKAANFTGESVTVTRTANNTPGLLVAAFR